MIEADGRAINQSYSQPVRLRPVSPYHPSALAGYAVHRAAIVHADFLKRTLTGRARQTATAVHQQFLREISRLTITANEIPQRRAALNNRPLHNLFNILHQTFTFLPIERARLTDGFNPRDRKSVE